jgi:hypothetical protein
MFARRREVSWPLLDCPLCTLDPCVCIVVFCRGHVPGCFDGCSVGRRVAGSQCVDAKRIRNAALEWMRTHEQCCPYATLIKEQEEVLAMAQTMRSQRPRMKRSSPATLESTTQQLQEQEGEVRNTAQAEKVSTTPDVDSSQHQVKPLYQRLRQEDIALAEVCGDDLQNLSAGQKRIRTQAKPSTYLEVAAGFVQRTHNPDRISIGYAAASQSSMSGLIELLRSGQASQFTNRCTCCTLDGCGCALRVISFLCFVFFSAHLSAYVFAVFSLQFLFPIVFLLSLVSSILAVE